MPSFKETRVRCVAGVHRGDQIAVERGDYKHHMIVIEDPIDLTKVRVIHYYSDTLPGAAGAFACCGKSGVPIAEVRRDVIDISADMRKGRVYRIDYSTYTSPYETVQRAENKLGEGKFSPFTNNCEHFATWCKTGIYESLQSQEFMKKRVVEGAKQASIEMIKAVEKDGVKQVAREGAKAAAKNTAQTVVKEGAKSVAKNGVKQGMWQGTKTTFRYAAVAKNGANQVVRQGCKTAVRDTAKTAAKESAKTAAKEGTKAAAKSGGKSFGKEIMENQGAVGIGLTVAMEGYEFWNRWSESEKKRDNGQISQTEYEKEMATHAVKGVANGTATVVGATVGQTLIPIPFVGGMIGAMAGKAAVWLGGEALAELTK
ncbi:hypothetical protein Bbelb_245110 [Branchiostoma belcheri]|nr:hypothetical protein Bbelb_245110 [Branchiostoma belcheri]